MPTHAAMEKYISSQVRYWQQQKAQIDVPAVQKSRHPFVTISREYGCNGFEVGKAIADICNNELGKSPAWAAYDRQLLDRLIEDTGLSSSLIETFTTQARNTMTELIQTSFSHFPSQVTVFHRLVETVALLAMNGNVIMVGRASNPITRSISGGFHVRLIANMEDRVANIRAKTGLGLKEAENVILEKGKARDGFIKEYVKFDVENPHNYNLIINISGCKPEQTARVVIEGMKNRGML